MMDTEDKWFAGFTAFVFFIILVVLGVGVWAVVQLVQWITTK